MMKLLKAYFTRKSFKKTKTTTGEYIIEKISKTKGNQIYVKWRILQIIFQ